MNMIAGNALCRLDKLCMPGHVTSVTSAALIMLSFPLVVLDLSSSAASKLLLAHSKKLTMTGTIVVDVGAADSDDVVHCYYHHCFHICSGYNAIITISSTATSA